MSEANRLLADWMKLHMEKRKLSQNKLAKLTGIGLTTINRYCDPNDNHEPRIGNVMTLSRYFGDKPPLDIPENPVIGFAEDGVAPIFQDQDDENWNGNLTEWTVKDRSMQVMGYLPGDTVSADGRLLPVDGDVVVCNLYTMDGTKARTCLRVFKSPSYLMPATTDAKSLEIHEVGKTAAIFGVIYEMRRTRQTVQ
jgi:transcriptional regulator with XRE-family HTH domain